MRKKLAVLLIASMTMASLLVACGNKDAEKETTTKATEADKNDDKEKETETDAPKVEAVELGDVDASTGFMAGKTDWITLKGDFEKTFTFKHEGCLSAAKNAYESVIIEFSTEGIGETTNAQSHYYTIVCNGGAWNWNGAEVADAATNWTGTPTNAVVSDDEAVTAQSILENADATVVIKREGTKLTINGTFTNGTNTATWTAEVDEAQLPEEINLHLGGEFCKLTGVSYK